MKNEYKNTKSFIKTALIGGVGVIFPIALLLIVFGWLFHMVEALIDPITQIIVAKSNIQEVLAKLLVIITIVTSCFAIGVLVKTKLGNFIHLIAEKWLGKWVPGYKLSSKTFQQFFGENSTLYSGIAIVKPYANEVLMTGFITQTHKNGMFTVFVPTGPNPTSGNIFHLPASLVSRINVPIEEAMKSVVACGIGSEVLLNAYAEVNQKTKDI